jgi:hypothetical protein
VSAIVRRAGLLAGALLAVGCGGSPAGDPSSEGTGFSGTPLLQIAGTADHVRVAVRTSPSPPTRGVAAVELTVTDADGALLDGLAVSVTPWMPDMGHGSSVAPTVRAAGDGVYLVENLYFFMPGRWQLRTHLQGAAADDAAPEFQIP